MQFVTAGMSGALTGVDLQLTRFNPNNNAGQYEFVIANNVTFDSSGFVTAATPLAKIDGLVSSLSATGGIVNFDTSALGLYFNAGDQFVLALTNPDGLSGLFGWATGTSTDAPGTPFHIANFSRIPYPGGDAFRQVTPAGAYDGPFLAHADFGFRTYVGAVPEPGTWALMLIGFAAIGFQSRRRLRAEQAIA